jgi:hypothetical protein
MRDGEKPMIMRVLNFSRFAALLLVGLGFGAAPAAAQGCCYAPTPIVVQPYYQSCSCCGCGSSSYYGSYYAAWAYPSAYYGYQTAGYGYGYGAGYGYGDGYTGYQAPIVPRYVAPRVYAPRVYPRYVAYPRYFAPRRPLVARY